MDENTGIIMETEQTAAPEAAEVNTALTNEPETGAGGGGPAETEAQTPDAPQEAPDTPVPAVNVQDAETNRRNAAARRRAEQERRYAQMQAEADRRVKDAERAAVIAATGGKVNPYTGKQIESLDELNAYNAAFEAENARKTMTQAGIDPKVIDTLISQHPAVKQAEEAARNAAKANAAARQQMRQRLIEQDIADIGKIDPSIKSFDDLMDSAAGEQTEQLVRQRGLSYLEAFKLVNFDRVSSARVAAQEKAHAEKAGGKAHLESTAQRSPDTVSVPSETMQMYRNAGFTEKEAREKYAQYLNSKKKG